MARPKVYIETTIPSYLASRPSRDLLVAAHQQITREWWESRRTDFDLYVSEFVIQEVRAGDASLASKRLALLAGIPLLSATNEIIDLAQYLITDGPIPQRGRGRCPYCHSYCLRM